MSLAKLIRRKSEAATAIPAIPAIPATDAGEQGATIAKIATIAVANPTESKVAKVSPGNTARGWLVRYPDGGMIETYIILADGTYPTRAEVLRDYPGAIDAEAIPEAEQEKEC